MAHFTRLLVLLGIAAATSACGGGPGGGGPPPATGLSDAQFVDTYFTFLESGTGAGAGDSFASTGTVTSDGAGNASHTQTLNHAGTLSGPSTTDTTYEVAADGTMDVRIAGSLFARGGLSSDGRLALLGIEVPGAWPGVMIQMRREGLHGLASLSGSYRYVELLFAAGNSVAFAGDATFDGGGAGTISGVVNNMGTTSDGLPGSISYTVIGDGTSTLTSLPFATREGGVAAGGDIAIWSGTTNAGPPSFSTLAVAIRAPASAGLATLHGTYWIVSLSRDPVSGSFRSLRGTLDADGAGNLTLHATSNTDGTIVSEPPQSATYSVSPGGKLTVTAGGDLLVGGVTEDGRYAVVGGGANDGSSPTIGILCRKYVGP